jgi:energy-converting hydrogenase A subunit M
MNIENLKEYLETNDTIANYRKVCEIIEEHVLTGNAKIAQLKELERYFKFHKQGNKFVFTEVYEVPLQKIDGRGKSEGSRNNNSATYIKTIEKLILDLLIQGGKHGIGFGKVFLSKNSLLKELKMINENYPYCKERIPKLSKFMNISEENVLEYFDKTNDMLERNLEGALKSLETQCLVLWSREITVVEAIPLAEIMNSTEIVKSESIDVYGEKIINYNYCADKTVQLNHREGTDFEKTFILQTEKEILKELNCDSKQKIIQMRMWESFKEKVNTIVLKELNIAFYYKSYKILFNEKHINEAVDDIYESFQISKEDKTNHQSTLNKEIIDRNMKNTEKRHAKAIEEKSKIIGNLKDNFQHDRLIRRSEEDYIADNNKLNNTLIASNAKDITDEVKKTKVGISNEKINKEIENLFIELDK